MTYRFAGVFASPPRLETNASQRPSGDQRGIPSRRSPEVNCRASSEPSIRATQTAPRYSFASLSIHHTWYATRAPSGEMRGSATPVSSQTSSGRIPATGPDYRTDPVVMRR